MEYFLFTIIIWFFSCPLVYHECGEFFISVSEWILHGEKFIDQLGCSTNIISLYRDPILRPSWLQVKGCDFVVSLGAFKDCAWGWEYLRSSPEGHLYWWNPPYNLLSEFAPCPFPLYFWILESWTSTGCKERKPGKDNDISPPPISGSKLSA